MTMVDSFLNNARRANTFIAVIDERNISNKDANRGYELLNALGKTMYAIIKKDVNWDNIKHIPWRKVYYFEYDAEIPAIMQVISMEVVGGGFYT